MSRFTNELVNNISPYVPGEQLRDKTYIKLNTNENPYYTSEKAVKRISEGALKGLDRYSDPESADLVNAIAEYYGVKSDNVLVTNGSDEALAFSFIAYGKSGVCYPDITYGFYDVIANLFECPVEHIKLKGDFSVCVSDYYNKDKTIVLANPNAQTGIALSHDELEAVINNNPNSVVIIDQAYADFSDCNVIPLINKYDNLIVVNTFSKSRSLAGARVGYVIASKQLISDLKKVKNSFHPYNVNSVSAALATEAIKDDGYFKSTVAKIVVSRGRLTARLKECGFEILPSSANFVLAKSSVIGGKELYERLKSKGVLVRYLSDERISDYVRITVGTDEEIEKLIKIIKSILTEYRK